MTAPAFDPALLSGLDETSMGIMERSFGFESGVPSEGMSEGDMGDTSDSDFLDEEEQRKQSLAAMFGPEFPLIEEPDINAVDDPKWKAWATDLVVQHRAGRWRRLYMAQRNRLFRAGFQWVSAQAGGPWREPQKPREQTRAVYNLVSPALDQRIQIIVEQRPGFQTRPLSTDPEDQQKAEAQQIALEYLYDAQQMPSVLREALYWAGTDGCSFLHSYWDVDAGPWHEGMRQDGTPFREMLGDPRTEVLRIEEVSVSANASSICKPHYWVIRKPLTKAYAVAVYGAQVADADEHEADSDEMVTGSSLGNRLGFEVPGDHELYEDQDIVDRYTVYCEPCEYLPEGLTLITVGSKVLFVGPLVYGIVPIVRLTDGASDPAFFPKPIMEDWIDHQVRINAMISRWVDSVRQNVGGRFISRKGAIIGESFIGGGAIANIEVRNTGGNLSESITQAQPFLVGQDLKELLALEIQAFQEKSGASPESRGAGGGDESGRALLVKREQLERIHAEPVAATTRAMVEWSKVNLHIIRWGYDEPRTVGVIGRSRTDLAHALNADDFDGVCDVTIDPETLVPLPRALRLFLLDQALEKGAIDLREYRRRLPFAYTRDFWTPDEDQAARAKRKVEAIKQMQQPPEMRWTDDEAIHQDILQRDILLRDDLDPQVIELGFMVWQQLAQQAQMKGMLMAPAMAAPTPGGKATPGNPATQPLMQNNPSVAAAPVKLSSGAQDASNREALMDRTAPI